MFHRTLAERGEDLAELDLSIHLKTLSCKTLALFVCVVFGPPLRDSHGWVSLSCRLSAEETLQQEGKKYNESLDTKILLMIVG